ncbi:putative OsmC-like protein [Virgibacillus natechei]|uniref:OsmC-like protein n=1 Tax=Virgibacillus natechei TaxID=1216297 RepID=A0ABS4IIB2_9BACI|nr:OsmC family protein [Virgibacillus natechei]MBP1970613.1 putative OsmC-like protein [Virgibacillus natechei]UZD13996.1 OsmC family protein [Virgibacillus natechei]
MQFYLKENGMRTDLEYGELCISGNEDYGFRPFQLMVASIAGCSASVFRKILAKQRTEVQDLTIDADVVRNPEEANRIEEIKLRYVIKGYNLDPEKLYKNLEIARKNCSMVRSVENSIKIEENIDTIELSR